MALVRRQRLGQAGLFTALVLSTAQLAAQAAPARTQRPAAAPPAAKATQVASVEGITEYSLPNGLRVLLFPDQSKATVTVNITYLVGSKHEGYGETGMAHLLEHLVFKGSKGHTDIPGGFQKRGARYNGSTIYDRTNYFETLPAADSNLVWALELEADRMINSFIAKKDLESEFSVVRNELESGENNPARVLWQRTSRAAFQWHGYGRSTIGSRSDVEGVPVERLQAFYRKFYQPDNAVMVIAGKFEPARALAMVEQTFGRIPRPKRTLEAGNLLFAAYTVEPPQDGEREVIVRRVGDAHVIMTAFHVPSGSHPDAASVDVLDEVLGNNPSGRLYKALVDTKLAASVGRFAGGALLQMRDPTLLITQADVRTSQSLDTARAAMERALEVARTSAFTAEEVDRAKTTLLKNFDLTLNNSEIVGYTLSEWAAMGDWRLMFMHRDRVEKVTPADVQRVAAAYLKPENRTTSLFVATPNPDRADIPAAPNVAAMVADYKGRAVVQAGEAFDASPKNIEARVTRSTLPSGMHVTLLPKLTRGNRVNAQIVLRHGTEASLTGKGLVPVYSTSMLSRGTTTLTRQQIADSLSKLKAQVSIVGGGNNAVASIETTRPNLIAALDLVAQQLKSPRYDADELEKMKKEQLAAIEQAKSNPQVVAGNIMARKLMPKPKGHPLYVSTADEQIADINAVTAEALKAFHSSQFGASYGDVAVVGDFDAPAVSAALAKHFGDWKNPQPFARLVRTYARTDSTFESVETPDKPNAMYQAGMTLELSDADADYPAMFLANWMYGGSGMASRLLVRLRQKEGISYGAISQLNAQSLDKYAVWQALAIYAPQNVERVQTAVRQEIDQVLKDGFTADEVEKNKTGYLQQRSQGRASDPDLTRELINRRFAGRTFAWDDEYEKKVAALTPDQVNAALRKYLDPKRLIVVRAGDFAKNPPAKATP